MSAPEHNVEVATPWYRQFWPWVLVGILGWGVLSSLITLSVALKHPPQMVSGDYQALGKLLVDDGEHAARARELGLSGHLAIAPDRMLLTLSAAPGIAPPESLLIKFEHPGDAARDRQVLFHREGAWRYAAESVALPAKGRVIAQDPAESWWITGRFELMQGRAGVELRPDGG
ncbi:MAG: hypothetical protein Kow0020_08910 [Wenzhouxiangellaceae bacterium]